MISTPHLTNKTGLSQTLAHFLAAHGDVQRLWVALSGGLDSCVLLHLLAELRPKIPVQVLHINHQLSPDAGKWQAHCKTLAKNYGFPLVAETVEVNPARRGVEMAARQARYAVFEHYLAPGDMLLMAHHQNDQAETLLLRLLRGTGLRGLGAMPEARPLGAGKVGRPLLPYSRAQLRAYAEAESLRWVEDESNQSPDFDRNYLRLEVLPLLARRWPNVAERWAQTARLLRESEELLNEYAAEDLQAAGLRPERLGESLALDYLADRSEPRRNAVLRHWMCARGYQPPEQVHLKEVNQFLEAGEDSQPLFVRGEWELRRYAQRLYLLPCLPAITGFDHPWHPAQPLALPGSSLLSAAQSTSGLRADREYRVTLRQGGERCQPHNRHHSQTLKKLLQEYNLEPWLRGRIPLIYAGDQLAAVGDLWVCREFYTEGEAAWQVSWSL